MDGRFEVGFVNSAMNGQWIREGYGIGFLVLGWRITTGGLEGAGTGRGNRRQTGQFVVVSDASL